MYRFAAPLVWRRGAAAAGNRVQTITSAMPEFSALTQETLLRSSRRIERAGMNVLRNMTQRFGLGRGRQRAYRTPGTLADRNSPDVRRLTVLGVALALIGLSGCTRTLYTFKDIPRKLPAGQVNLLTNNTFQDASAKICTFQCNASSGWSIENSTVTPPTYKRTQANGPAESLEYHGEKTDNGVHKDIELYHGAIGPSTRAGRILTFTLWVTGTCKKCAPFVGIEAFDTKNHYLGEADQYFLPPKVSKPVQVSYVLPKGSVVVAAYIQVPELYPGSEVDLVVQDASLTSALPTAAQLAAASKSQK